MTWLWKEDDKRLSIVPRWTIVTTIQKQTVADHCFRVARLVERMATEFGLSATIRQTAVELALHHDDDEHVTGDIPSIAKKYLDKDALHRDFPSRTHLDAVVRDVIKVADKVEAIIFLRTEKALGNQTVDKVLRHVCESLYDYCQKNGLMHWYAALEGAIQTLDLQVDPLEK